MRTSTSNHSEPLRANNPISVCSLFFILYDFLFPHGLLLSSKFFDLAQSHCPFVKMLAAPTPKNTCLAPLSFRWHVFPLHLAGPRVFPLTTFVNTCCSELCLPLLLRQGLRRPVGHFSGPRSPQSLVSGSPNLRLSSNAPKVPIDESAHWKISSGIPLLAASIASRSTPLALRQHKPTAFPSVQPTSHMNPIPLQCHQPVPGPPSLSRNS